MDVFFFPAGGKKGPFPATHRSQNWELAIEQWRQHSVQDNSGVSEESYVRLQFEGKIVIQGLLSERQQTVWVRGTRKMLPRPGRGEKTSQV